MLGFEVNVRYASLNLENIDKGILLSLFHKPFIGTCSQYEVRQYLFFIVKATSSDVIPPRLSPSLLHSHHATGAGVSALQRYRFLLLTSLLED